MTLKQTVRRSMGVVLAVSMISTQSLPALAGTPLEPPGKGKGTLYQSKDQAGQDIYKVYINGAAGGTTELTNKSGGTWNDLERELIPGQTIVDTGSGYLMGEIEQKVKTVYPNTSYGLEGISLSGDVSAKKSYFMFQDEIMCMGAGISNESEYRSGKTLTVVENKAATKYTKLALPVPATYQNIMSNAVLNAVWNPIKDTPTKADHTRNWLYVGEGSAPDSDVQYAFIFPKTLKQSGVYYQLKTTEKAIPYNFELWTEAPSYEYLIVPRPGEANNLGSYEEKTIAVANTPEAQAAYHASDGLLAANIWSQTSFDAAAAGFGTISANQAVSFFLKQQTIGEEGTVSGVITVPQTASKSLTLELGIASTSMDRAEGISYSSEGDSTTLILNCEALKGQTVPVVIHQKVTEAIFHNDTYTMGLELNPLARLGRTTLDNPHDSTYYVADYWKTINRNRIPGTTVLGKEEKAISSNPEVIPENTTTDADWLGGKTRLDQAGAMGVQMTGGDVTGFKSWFLFDNQIVCLGAGLRNSSGHPDAPVITVLDNVKLREDKNQYITIDYKTKKVSDWLDPAKENRETDVIYNKANNGYTTNHTWTFIKQSVSENVGIGYYFPKAAAGEAEYRFAENQDSAGKSRLWYELWLNHGSSGPASYEYVILPEVENQAAVYKYYTSPDNVTLANTETVQAVYHKNTKTLGANFWSSEGGELKSDLSSGLTVHGKASVIMSEAGGKLKLAVSDPTRKQELLKLEVGRTWYEAVSSSPEITVDSAVKDKLAITVDLSGKTGEAYEIEVSAAPPAQEVGETVDVAVGDRVTLPVPDGMEASEVTWSCAFLKDGEEGKTTVNNAGYSKFKRELQEGESEGVRKAGPTDVSHLAEVEKLENGSGMVTGRGMGNLSVIAEGGGGERKIWDLHVHAMSEEELPEAVEADFLTVRSRWQENLIGSNVSDMEGGQQILDALEEAAEKLWDEYEYKGLEACGGIPWPMEQDKYGGPGNPEVPYEDDAVEFRPVVQNLLVMAKAYKTEGTGLYQNSSLKQDMVHILDWFSKECYGPKTQTDNWWTWEIGIPKDLVPVLILLCDDLTEAQRKLYCRGILFFQPDPYHEGVTGFATTHAQGYRKNEGANLLDCSVISMGVGAVLNDSEQMALALEASSSQFIIHTVKNSKTLSTVGYDSGFYEDGSYLDHSFVPYTGSYGIEFFRGGVNLATMLSDTPWAYPEDTMNVLEQYVTESFGASIYRGLMLDSLKGRAVSRKESTNRASGRDVMGLILRLTSVVNEEQAMEFKNLVKNWMLADEEYLDSLKGPENMRVRAMAEDILADDSISGEIGAFHKNMAYMDRVIHRTDDWLANLAMYSSRIQNCEVMNGENLYGWHQGDGALYLFDEDDSQYSDDYWNTVNPMRMPGTTVVPVPMGNGTKDGSGLYQEGDYRSLEDWVGGSVIGNYGINGMAVSGENTSQKVVYAPELKALKSWFMFGEEIVCLGAGISNTSEELSTETIIENRKLSQEGTNILTINGRPVELELVNQNVKDLAEGRGDTKGTKVESVNWAHLQGNGNTKGIGYYFPDPQKPLYVRRAANTGDWSNIGTTEGEATRSYLEMWYDHGQNPQGDTYEYTLLPGKRADETEDYAYHPKVTILSNTPYVQAVYNSTLQITGANFWTDTKQNAGILSADKKASVMMEENEMEGTLTLAVSDPTMKNSKTIHVWVDRPITDILSKDDNVKIEKTETGFQCTVSTDGTNGASSYAKVQLSAAVIPGAYTIQKGGSCQFSAYDYENQEGEFIWSVKGTAPLAAGTRIEEGLLTVSSHETNGKLTVQAVSASDSALVLTASVTVSGNIETVVPEDIEELETGLEELFNRSTPSEATDPKVQQKVYASVASLATASNAELKKSGIIMGHLEELEQLYIEVAQASGGGNLSSEVKNIRDDEEIRDCDIKITGAALSIPLKLAKATDSNAVMSFERADGSGMKKNTERKMDWDNAFWLNIWLDLLDPDGHLADGFSKIQPAAPIVVDMRIPGNLEEDRDIYLLHYGKNGELLEMEKLEPEDGRIRAVITGLSRYALVNAASSIEEPEKPGGDPEKPGDDPEKPEEDPEKPEKDPAPPKRPG